MKYLVILLLLSGCSYQGIRLTTVVPLREKTVYYFRVIGTEGQYDFTDTLTLQRKSKIN